MNRPSLDRLYPIIALALLAAATLWLERATRSDEPRPRAEVREDPDFIGHNIRITQFGDDGGLRYILVADQIRHYPLGDQTVFDEPRLHYHTEDGLIRVLARRGETQSDGDTVFLSGNARVLRDSTADSPALSVTSETLTLWPDEHRAATDDFVTLTQGRSIATADGMRADNLFGTLELIGNARVTLPPRTHGEEQ